MAAKQQQAAGVGVVVVLLAGLVALGVILGQQPTSNPTPASSSTSAPTTTPEPSTSTTPSPPDAGTIWTTPVAGLEPGDPRWTDRLCRHADVWGSCGARWTTAMGLDQTGNDYSVPIYDAADATTCAKAARKVDMSTGKPWPGLVNLGPGECVPFNPRWRPADGKDGYMVIVDHGNGHQWWLWNVSWDWVDGSHQTDVNNNFGCLDAWLRGQFQPATMLCAASAAQVRDPQGRPVDTRTWRGNMPGASGGGWHLAHLLVRPDEVAAGEIRHALHFVSANTMDGPVCPVDRRHDPAHFGETCGGAVAPAGQLEKHHFDGQPLTHQVPEGTRFSIDVTDAEIEAWLDDRGYTGSLRRTARTVAVALRDYGWFLGDSSPTSATWVFDGSPTAQRQWRELGVTGTGRDLVRGLVTGERLRAWAPPEQQCADGTWSTWFCHAVDARYPR